MDAKKVRIHRAQPAIKAEPVQDTQIILEEEIPRSPTLEVAQEAFTVQGRRLEQALHDHLPGGTYNALLIAMLERKHSLLVVSENDARQRPATAPDWDPEVAAAGEED